MILRHHRRGFYLRILALFLCLLALRQVPPTLRPAPSSSQPSTANLSLKLTRNFLQEVRDRPEDFVANAGTGILAGKIALAYLEQEEPSPPEAEVFVPSATVAKSVHRRIAPASSDDGDLFS